MQIKSVFGLLLPLALTANAYYQGLHTRDVDYPEEGLAIRDVEVMDAILTLRGLDDETLESLAPLLPRLDRPNKPSFPPGYFSTLPPSRPHQGVPHHNWDSPVPPKPGAGSSSYFPGGGGGGGGSRPAGGGGGGGRRASFKRRALEDLDDFFDGYY